MKTTGTMRLFLFLLLSFPYFLFAQSVTKVSVNIDQAVLYADRAQLESHLSTNLKAGLSKIEIEGLASTIDQNSIKVTGKGAFTLLSVDFKQDFISVKKLAFQDSIEIVEASLEELAMHEEVLKQQEKMLMDNTAIKAENEDLLKSDLEEMSGYFEEKLLAIGKKKLALKRKIKDAKERLGRLQQQMNTDPSVNSPLGKVILTLKAEAATKAEIDLNYIAYGAGWGPTYDIRVSDMQKPIALSQKAMVFQHTGVDWKNVKLVLSTTAVNKNAVKPELFPKYLSFYEPRQVLMQANAMRKDGQGMRAPVAMADAEMVEMQTAANYSQSFDGALSTEYRIDLPYTIKSGSTETVEVQEVRIEANYLTYLVPNRDQNGFLVAEIKDWEKYNLMNAEANVYFDGAFVGKTFIQKNAKDEDLKISLGRDERIIAERKEIKDFKSKKAFGSNIRESFGYEINLKNTRKETVKLVVEDQVPVSQNSEIEVQIEEMSGAVLDKESGKLKWQLELPANGNQKLTLKYEVKYPKDKQVLNL